MITKLDYLKYFPFSKIRKSQEKAITFILNSFLVNNKNYVVLEAGTGVGKSAIAITVSRYLQEHLKDENYHDCSYILTTQKILQDQYVKDYSGNYNSIPDIEDLIKNNVSSISSSSNYHCQYHLGSTCAESLRALKITSKSSQFYKTCSVSCVYKQEKTMFLKTYTGVTNFAYFLAETMYAKEFEPRKLLVIDEAHNCDTELGGFIDIEVDLELLKIIGLSMIAQTQQHLVYQWIKTVYEPGLRTYKEMIEDKIKTALGIVSKTGSNLRQDLQAYAGNNGRIGNSVIKLIKKNELLDKYACKARRFLKYYQPENWIMNIFEEDDKIVKIEFKPTDISNYANELLFKFGKKTLMMSATILDKGKFCTLNGINIAETDFISLPSTFPPENKPIYYCPAGSMGFNYIDDTLPVLLKLVKKILKKHRKEKGIIHCHSYKIMNYIFDTISDKRLLCHDSSNRNDILEQHLQDPGPTVLLSPSMEEGVDLKNNFSRFQVICKVPYPYLGDKLIKSKMEKWEWWYSYQTVKKIVQSIGRSIRSKEDHARTYILDGCWENFYYQNKKLFPTGFKKYLKN